MLLYMYGQQPLLSHSRLPIKAPPSDRDEKGGQGEKGTRRGRGKIYISESVS